ncbi:MAG: HAMP domain-containing sensor histidine kinase [Myxococcota bacterium]
MFRLALALVCVVLPALAIAYRIGAPEHPDPTLERFAFAAVAAGLLGASYVSEAVRERLHLVTQIFTVALGVWILYYAAESGFEGPDLGAILIFQFGLLVVFTRFWEVVGNTLWWVAGIAAMLVLVMPTPVTHPAFLLGLPLALSTVGGVAAWERDRLISTVIRQRDQLDTRVRERTADLEREVEQRRAAERAALDANRAKSGFLTRMSHELRTPINAIVGYTELVREELEGDDLAADLDRVLTASGQLLRLVDDVLDVARIERGDLELRSADVPVETLVRRALATSRPGIEARGNALEIADLPKSTVFVDADRVVQILTNLLANAGRFTSDGTVSIAALEDAEAVSIEVSDTGRGIPPAALDRVFEPFTQVDESTVREVDGAGLGLSIARDLALRMGGRITVRSELGAGSTFTLALPRLAPTA